MPRSLMRRLVAVLVLAGPLFALWPTAAASAHPLGNFTVNRYARLEVSAGVLRVHYVYDAAEIPTFQQRADLEGDRTQLGARRAEEIAGSLMLRVDDVAVGLRADEHLVETVPGEGGLSTLRITIAYSASVPGWTPGSTHGVVFTDGNEPRRVGWREVVVVARGDSEILSSDAPARDVSDELRSYPENLLQAPLDRRAATFSVRVGTVTVPAAELRTRVAPAAPIGGFGGLAARTDGSVGVTLGLLALSFGFGVVHAIGPGHGKTLMAAYLVGTKGRRRDAVALGGAVSLMHTVSVLVIAVVLFRLDRSTSGERAYPWFALASGLTVIGVGAWLLRSRLAARSASAHHDQDPHQHHDHGDEHDHSHHEHDHHEHTSHHEHEHSHQEPEHGHDHGHGPGGHTHALPADVRPLSRRGLLALGASGGLFPSPSAVVVLVSAFALGRAGTGLALVAAFSAGLAFTLTAVGLGLVYGRSMLERRGLVSGRTARALPVAGAALLIVLGVVITARAVPILS